MSPDFLTGFESGIFLRNSEEEFKEYGCPTEKVDVAELSAFKDILPQAKAMLTMAMGGKPDPTLEEILTTIELFVDSVENFIGVCDRGYCGDRPKRNNYHSAECGCESGSTEARRRIGLDPWSSSWTGVEV